MPVIIYQILVAIVVSMIAAAMAPKPPGPKPASLTDFQAPTANSSSPIPVVFGSVLITGPNVVWYGDLRTSPITTKGGKK